MITHISLENWRSHERTSLQFRKGTNLLIGIMGSGKSSVLDAMSFALFGTFPAIEHRRLSLDELIRHQKDYAKIRLGLEWKGAKYEIIREIRKGLKKDRISSDAEIRKDGKLAEKGQTAVTKYAEQLLQTDYALFSRAIYSEQNNIDYFLSIDPGKRKEEMDALLGLDRFEAARANSVTVINRTKSARKALDDRFSRQKLEEIRKKEKEAEAKCAKFEQDKKALSETLEKARALYLESGSKFSGLKSKKERADALREEASRAKGAIGQLREELAGKEAGEKLVDEAKAKKSAAEKTLDAEKKGLLELQGSQTSLAKEAGTLENRLESAKNAQTELESAKKEMDQILSGKKPGEAMAEKQRIEGESIGLSALAQSLSSEIRKLEESKARISPELSRCPVCRSPLTKDGVVHVMREYDDEIRQKTGELRTASAKKEESARQCLEIEAKMRRLESIVQKQKLLEKTAAQCGELSKKIPRMQEEMAKISEKMQAMREAVEKATSLFQQAAMECKEAEELLLKKNRLEKAEGALKRCESGLGELKFSESEFENARKELEERKLGMEKLSLELNSVSSQLRDAAEFLALAASERAELEAMDREISKLFKLEEELSVYKNALLETQAGMRREVVEAINTAMNGIWQIVYPYGDYKGLRMSADEKGYRFDIYDGVWRPAELVSGGERASIALAFRIALATVLTPNMSLLVLDEPTHNLDKEAVGVLAHALQYNLPELVEQSFVITHEEGLMGSEFASTYRMGRDKSANSPTAVEEI